MEMSLARLPIVYTFHSLLFARVCSNFVTLTLETILTDICFIKKTTDMINIVYFLKILHVPQAVDYGLNALLQQSISKPVLYEDFVYECKILILLSNSKR